MFYKTAFWILTFLTAISAVFQFLGYDFLEVLIVLLLLDSISFGAVVEIERRKISKEMELGKVISQKLETLENICKDVFQMVSVNSAVYELEEKLNLHKDDQKNSLDKIAEKTLQLEKKINDFGAKLAEHLQDVAKSLKEDESVSDYIYMDEDEE